MQISGIVDPAHYARDPNQTSKKGTDQGQANFHHERNLVSAELYTYFMSDQY